ncbi:hypothetical protein ACSSWA_07940 [Melioribacter sp. Ez-97]|uniref:hypothetical protein n=1 Tax=Melioribacter sp. Ez-97 TaxID=3423434 RepID=UPI003EDAAF51
MANLWKKILILFLFAGAYDYSFSQNKIIDELLDNALKEHASLFSANKDYNLIISLPRKLEGLRPYLLDYFRNSFEYENGGGKKIILVINDASTSYSLIERGFFTDDFLERSLYISGMLIYPEESGFGNALFSGSVKDTVLYDDYAVNDLMKLPVEQGELPDKTKLKDILQPVLIVATLITSVILLFTVRSN